MDINEATSKAQKYTEDMLSFFGLNTVVEATHDEEVISLSIPSTHLNGFLIGSRAETLHAFQNMVITYLKAAGYEFARVNLDIAHYKQQRQERLVEQAKEWIKELKDNGGSISLHPMNAADRRIIHQLASEYGLETESVGEGRDRHIVLKASGVGEG
ncbi:single-stranded DNA-binding protein [Candidatus Saccharibacteria bacterium]|nr:single-stranded DNA-binding protein [Candidatus Saccharibacteria bacterium]